MGRRLSPMLLDRGPELSEPAVLIVMLTNPLAPNSVQRARIMKWVRYAAVSVVANATTLTTLGILVGLIDFDAGWSNVIATALATIPSFELNRRWVWAKRGQASLSREVIPFWVWAFVELALSSLAVHVMGDHATSAGWARSTRTLAVEITTVGATGALWLIQFALFDRVLFRGDKRSSTASVGAASVVGGGPASMPSARAMPSPLASREPASPAA